MAFEFQTMRNRVLQDVWLNAELFAEEVTITPVAGVPHPVTVHIDSDRDRDFNDSGATRMVEKIRVLCSRIEDEEQNTKGFLRTPAIGTQLLRSTDNDPYQEPYIYTGEIEDERPWKWRLVFERERIIGQGLRT